MEAPAALNVTPLNAPHRELEYFPLVDKDFQIKDLVFDESPLLSYCRCRDDYSKGLDVIGLWESNLPRYLIPSVLIFPEIIHYCHSNYDPTQRSVMSPDQSVLSPLLPKLSMQCSILNLVKTSLPCPLGICLKNLLGCPLKR